MYRVYIMLVSSRPICPRRLGSIGHYSYILLSISKPSCLFGFRPELQYSCPANTMTNRSTFKMSTAVLGPPSFPRGGRGRVKR